MSTEHWRMRPFISCSWMGWLPFSGSPCRARAAEFSSGETRRAWWYTKKCVQVGRSRLLWAETESVQNLPGCRRKRWNRSKKIQKGMKKNVHKYMLCIYLYIYRCDHGGVGANCGSFCAAREENKEERKKGKQKQCIFSGWWCRWRRSKLNRWGQSLLRWFVYEWLYT